MLKQLGTGLAWLWVLGVVTTVLDLAGILQFATRTAASATHVGIWLLVWAAAANFQWLRPLPWLLWGSLLGVALLWVASFFLGLLGLFTQLPGQYAYSFFLDRGDNSMLFWRNSYVYWQRGRSLVVTQYYSPMPGMGQVEDFRLVRLVPITPLWYWARPLPEDGVAPAASAGWRAQGWVPVDRVFWKFSFDPAQQRLLDAQAAREAEEEKEAHRRAMLDPMSRHIMEQAAQDQEREAE